MEAGVAGSREKARPGVLFDPMVNDSEPAAEMLAAYLKVDAE